MKKIIVFLLLTLGLGTSASAEWQCNTTKCQAQLREAIQLTQGIIDKLKEQKRRNATHLGRTQGFKSKHRRVIKRSPPIHMRQYTPSRSRSATQTNKRRRSVIKPSAKTNFALQHQVILPQTRQQQLLLLQMRQQRQIDSNRVYCAVAGTCYIRQERGLVIREFPR